MAKNDEKYNPYKFVGQPKYLKRKPYNPGTGITPGINPIEPNHPDHTPDGEIPADGTSSHIQNFEHISTAHRRNYVKDKGYHPTSIFNGLTMTLRKHRQGKIHHRPSGISMMPSRVKKNRNKLHSKKHLTKPLRKR